MFPDETHQKIVQRLDAIEADLFRVYKQLERLRFSLQEQWRVLPNGQKWTREVHSKSEEQA